MECEPMAYYGFDFDGTLAEHCGSSLTKHAMPIVPMLERLKAHVAAGHECRIITARVSQALQWPEDPVSKEQDDWHRNFIQDWLEGHGLPRLKVQCHKCFAMIALYDDRAINVQSNVGIIHADPGLLQMVTKGLKVEPPPPLRNGEPFLCGKCGWRHQVGFCRNPKKP